MATNVTVMGAGIFGLTCAWELLKRGASVQVIDPNGPGAGASGGILGALAPHTPDTWNAKKDFQFHSLLAAQAMWDEVAEVSGLDPGYARTGRVQMLIDDRALSLAKQREVSAKALWQNRATWAVVGAEPDWGPISPTGLVVYDNLSARIHPRRAVAALAEAVRRKGSDIIPEGDQTGSVLWATGVAGLSDLSAALSFNVGAGQKGQAALLKFARPNAPQVFADGVHIIPHSDGTLAIGSTSEGEFETPAQTDGQLDALVEKAKGMMPLIKDAEVIQTWAGLRPRAVSRAPILGPWPGRPGHFVANGGFKIGFGMAPRVGQVMARLIADGDDLIPEDFRLESLMKSNK